MNVLGTLGLWERLYSNVKKVWRQKMKHFIPMLLFFFLMGILNFPACENPVEPGSPAIIAFETNRDGDYEIYKMDIDGNNPVNLTSYPANDRYPVFSPNGEHILFSRGDDSECELYIMDHNGDNCTRLTNNNVLDLEARFSPDGSKIVYVSWFGYDSSTITVMDSDGNNKTVLTEFGSYNSPIFVNNTGIIYASSGEWYTNLFHIDIDGKHRTRLTDDYDYFGRFFIIRVSPDSKMILFYLFSWEMAPDIYTMDINGQNVKKLNSGEGWCQSVEFSPNGGKILYALSDEIYLMDIDGSHQLRLTNDDKRDFSATFSADGENIIFVRNNDSPYNNEDKNEIYVMNIDGDSQVNLTNNNYDDNSPQSQPVR